MSKATYKTMNTRIRYNILSTIIYLVGIVLLAQLFNLQVIHGEEYRETSNTRLTRESSLQATRGAILDRSGTALATASMGFSVELYKTKIDEATLNNTILNIANLLEQNGDSYITPFPITRNFEFNFSDEESLINWKKQNRLSEEATVDDCIQHFKEKYKITNQDVNEVIKIIGIRYKIDKEGYSSTKSIKIAENISRESVLQFNERNLDFLGVNIVVESVRRYANENLASHILGYIGKITEGELDRNKDLGYDNDDYIGKTGVEAVFEKFLKGTNGTKQIDMTVDGTVTEEYVVKEAVAGSNVILTIDARLQEIAENAIEAEVIKLKSGSYGKVYDTNSASVVVMDVKTGEILAMASYPDYNPNWFVGGISKKNWETLANQNDPLYNRAIQGTYAPGSTFKMVTAMAALETGTITIADKVYDSGVYPLAHKPVCWIYTSAHTGHGSLNVVGAIQRSCNYFFYEMGNRLGIDNIEKYGRFFGLGERTGVELLGENAGTIANRRIVEDKGGQWTLGDTLSSAIGQSYNDFTPIQMVKYVAMLTNGGKVIRPTIIKNVVKSNGEIVPKEEVQETVDSVIGKIDETEDLNVSQENLDIVLEGMSLVTSSASGTAYNIFKNFNIKVGGKTGSAEMGQKTNGWFVGFAPFDDPEIAVAVMIEDGAKGGATGQVAKLIMEQYFGMNESQIIEDMTAIPNTEIQR